MPTNRTPINGPARTRISAEAIAAFRRMQAVDHDTTDSEWWDAHKILCRALKLPPWEWPCVLIPVSPPSRLPCGGVVAPQPRAAAAGVPTVCGPDGGGRGMTTTDRRLSVEMIAVIEDGAHSVPPETWATYFAERRGSLATARRAVAYGGPRCRGGRNRETARRGMRLPPALRRHRALGVCGPPLEATAPGLVASAPLGSPVPVALL